MAEGNKTLIGTRELASLFGLSDRRIQQLTADGTISAEVVTENGRRVRKYDLIPTVHAYVTSLQEKLKKGTRTDKEVELREQKLEADIELKKSQNELHLLKTEIAAGRYVSIEEVRMDYIRFFISFKKFATSLPARVIGMISGQLDPVEARKMEKDLADEVHHLLGAFVIAGVVTPDDAKNANKKKKSPDP